MNKKITCIIPFLNERGRIDNVLLEINKSKNINKIICIDDGSNDGGVDSLKKKFPHIQLISLGKNQGKTSAVKFGLKKTDSDIIFLSDADIIGLDHKLIDIAIQSILKHPEIDMILLRGKFVFPNSLISRSELIFSGVRVLHKKTLDRIVSKKLGRYQLEIAINDFMINNKKTVYWLQADFENIRKRKKYGFLKGLLGDLKMLRNVMSYGLSKYFYQILFFARKKL